MRVLLVSSYTLEYVTRADKCPPLSLLSVAATLQREGHEPTLLDLNIAPVPEGEDAHSCYLRRIQEKIREVQPGMIGMNCLISANFVFIESASTEIKKEFPDIPIVIGGTHPTLFAMDILRHCPAIDAIVIGEGEYQGAALADAYEANDRSQLAKCPALAYRDSKGEIGLNPRGNFMSYETEMDKMPDPAWELLHFPDYHVDHSNWYNPRGLDIKMSAPILTSRSCPYSCNFCSAHTMMGRGLRMRSAKRVVDEIEMLYRQHGVNYFGFVDDILNVNKKHIIGICNEIVRRGLVIQFESFNGYAILSMDEEIVDAMAQAGCIYAIMPIESGSDYMRHQIIGKKIPREKIFEVRALYAKYGMLTRGVFIMGFPEDTRETLEDTYQMIKELELDMNMVFNLIPFPGTKVFAQVQKDNLMLEKIDPKTLWKGDLHLNALQNQFYIKPYNLSMDDLLEYRAKFDEMKFVSSRIKALMKKAPQARKAA